MREVLMPPVPLAPYRQALGEERMAHLRDGADRAGRLLGDRTVWAVNSTAVGGGVAELLHALGPMARAIGLDVRWLVINGDPDFFTITKRLCTRQYGAPGDGGPLGPAERRHYRHVLDGNARRLTDWIHPGDVVVVHDAQPAGLVEAAKRCGATVMWRCHIGSDEPNEHTRNASAFLRPFVEPADATVFHTAGHVLDWAPRPHVIPPSIDPCSPKNMRLSAKDTTAILSGIGVLAGGNGFPVIVPVPIGAPVVVWRPAVVVRDGPPPPATTPMVVQVSRWDRLKDMAGVLEAFGAAGDVDGYLTLAGPDVSGVTDDPEAAEVFDECRRKWAALPSEQRSRIQLLCLPITDMRENAVVVNALQQHATAVVQKSRAEGFGLTATEAMWKSRPLLANAVGGLRDQVVSGESGLLLDDPDDGASATEAIRRLLTDHELAARLGAGARRQVAERFLPDRHLLDWVRLIDDVVTGSSNGGRHKLKIQLTRETRASPSG